MRPLGRAPRDAPRPAAGARRLGFHLGVLQFVFALGWTVYVVYLPQLARQAGIDPRWVPWILVLDHAVFAVCDWATGVKADRVARTIVRLGGFIAAVTAVSAAAFLSLPLIAPAGSPWPLLLLTVAWAATSSALRAPPLVLVGKYVAPSAHPGTAALFLLGIGVAGALSPYLGMALRDTDPRIAFALASLVVVLVTARLIQAERRAGADAVPVTPCTSAKAPPAGLGWFLTAVALLGGGFQLHYALNAAPSFLRFADTAQLDYLMPVFWVGFSLFLLPASVVTRRYGGLAAMALGALLGAAASWAVIWSTALGMVIAAQFAAGGAWGCALTSATTAALAIGRGGNEGRVAGMMFSLLAIAALMRIALTATAFASEPAVAGMLSSLPVFAWLAAGILLLALARRRPVS